MSSQSTVVAVPYTLIHVEDDDEWQCTVQGEIEEYGGLKFQDYIKVSSLEGAKDILASINGPIVIIMDLRLGGSKPNYTGLHWLLDDLGELVQRNASTAVFVISGQLSEGIRSTFTHKGIPENHIYEKGSWAETRNDFLKVLQNVVDSMKNIAKRNIMKGVSGQGIDPYLIHTFQATQETSSRDASEKGTQSIEPTLLPMLVRTTDKSWKYDRIPDLQVLGNIDNVFSCLGSLDSITALEQDPMVVKVEASPPGGTPDCRVSVPFVKANFAHNHIDEKGDCALVAIIDTGIDVLHEAFLDANGQSRILAIWDQTDETGLPPDGQKWGTEHTQEAINTYIQSGVVPPQLTVEPRDHGTHVASIAAGRAVQEFTGGVAPDAKIIVVIPDMETLPQKPQSLGYSVSHQLALEYIKSFAEKAKLPVVINVSQGMNAGAHDGTSSLEKGFDAITENGQAPGVVVVKSAGNERNQDGHAKLRMTASGSETLRWKSTTRHRGPDVIELWFKAGDQFRFSLEAPCMWTSEPISSRNPSIYGYCPDGNYYQLTYIRYDPDNGDSRLVITITAGRARSIALGTWSIFIETSSIKILGEIHAWVERRSLRPIAFINHLDEGVTLSIPGTAHYVITVGSITPYEPIRLADSSSYGPTRDGRNKPDLTAPGEYIAAAASKTRNGVISLCGTSMAAPHVTGAIALLFSYWVKQRAHTLGWKQYNALQIQAAITQGAQHYNTPWHPGRGFGTLDVESLIQELGCP